jgi:predicted Ser/Thr protein kinase
MLKRGLEEWTRNEGGAVYAIKDCPMHEEPLHLIPHQLRAEVEKLYGIYIEGDLCPQCRYALDRTYGGRPRRRERFIALRSLKKNASASALFRRAIRNPRTSPSLPARSIFDHRRGRRRIGSARLSF